MSPRRAIASSAVPRLLTERFPPPCLSRTQTCSWPGLLHGKLGPTIASVYFEDERPELAGGAPAQAKSAADRRPKSASCRTCWADADDVSASQISPCGAVRIFGVAVMEGL